MKTDLATVPSPRFSVVWKDSPGVSEKQLRLRQSFQSARPISGRPCGPSAQRIAQAALQVIVERLLAARPVLVDHRLVQDRHVARFLQVGGHAQDQPQRVVVEAAAYGIVAALSQRLILVKSAAALELGRGQVENAFSGARRDHVHETQQVLVESRKPMPRPTPDSSTRPSGTG